MSRKKPSQLPPPPWPVAPVPEIPYIDVTADPLERRSILAEWWWNLNDWLHEWRKRAGEFYRLLPTIEEQCRLLLKATYELAEEVRKSAPRTCLVVSLKRSCELEEERGDNEYVINVASEHGLLARCLGEYNDFDKDREAVEHYETALRLDPLRYTTWYFYVSHFIKKGMYVQAADKINAANLDMLERGCSESELGARILNWALAFPEIGLALRPEIVRICVAGLSRQGDKVIYGGVRLTHKKLRYNKPEVLRVLWAGMNGVPVHELEDRLLVDYWELWEHYRRYLSHVEFVPEVDFSHV